MHQKSRDVILLNRFIISLMIILGQFFSLKAQNYNHLIMFSIEIVVIERMNLLLSRHQESCSDVTINI